MAEKAGKKILVIGIGAGDPEYLTIQAVKALNRVDVFFVLDKGEEKDDLIRFRREVCERYIEGGEYRWVTVKNPVRRGSRDAYGREVEDWRAKRQAIFTALIKDEMEDGECGAFLVWGDPAFYDGTLHILEEILEGGRWTSMSRSSPASAACRPWPRGIAWP